MSGKERLNVLGIVWMLWSSMFIFVGVAFGLGFLGFAGVMSLVPDSNTGEPAPWWLPALFGGFGAAFGALFAAAGLLGVVGGWGVRGGRLWAKLVIGFLALTQVSSFPLGTLLAAFTAYVLLTPAPDAARPGGDAR